MVETLVTGAKQAWAGGTGITLQVRAVGLAEPVSRSGPQEKFVPNGSSEALKELDQHQVICDGKDVQDWSLYVSWI